MAKCPALLREFGVFVLPEERTKTFTLKVDSDRTITARFASLGVVDLDGDIIEPGAIGEQDVLLGAYNHGHQSLPPGYGKTYETAKAAMFKGQFLENEVGTETYSTLKQLKAAGINQEWSFRFFVEEGGFETRKNVEYYIIRKAKVSHVAPVEVGAGVNTGTVSIKSQRQEPAPFDYEKMAIAVAVAVAKAIKTDPDPAPAPEPEPQAADQKGEGLGDLIRNLRDQQEFSNDDLAEATGLSVASIGQILGGTLTPSASVLGSLAQKLDVRLSVLATAAEEDAAAVPQDEPPADAPPEEAPDDDTTPKSQSDESDADAPDDEPAEEPTEKDSDSEHIKQAMAILCGVADETDADTSPDQAAYRKLKDLISA